MTAAGERVDVGHHDGRSMDGGPIVSEQFLGPSAKLVAGPAVIGDLLDRVTIANPIEVGAPNVRCNT